MKNPKTIGKILIAIGVIHLFRRVSWAYGFGGITDNTMEILIISVMLIIIGSSLLFIFRKHS